MSRWFRHYAGMMRDDKLVRVAIDCGQTVERVVWVWGAILESAAELDDEGHYVIASAEISRFLRCKTAAIDSIVEALTAAGRVADGKIAKWQTRQYKSDKSAPRVALHRERKRNEQAATETLHETLPQRHRNAPETETETEYSEAKASALSADPTKAFWDASKTYLGKGKASLIGKWVRQHGQEAVAAAISAAQIQSAVNPVEFVAGRLRKNGTNGYGPGHSGIPL